MIHKTIHLKHSQPDEVIQLLIKNRIRPERGDFDIIISDYCTILKPNGEVLLKLLPRSLDLNYTEAAFFSFHDRLHSFKDSSRPAIANSQNPGSEGVIGFLDAVGRNNFCRETALTNNHLNEFKASMPFIRSASELMCIHLPERYAAQLAACEAGHSDYVIPSTVFSTVTLNRDVTASYHTDEGDYKPGIGVIAATWAKRRGKDWYIVIDNPAEGGLLVFPKYWIAVRLRTQDLLLCDVHECHGVTAIVGEAGTWARLSFVFYLRDKIRQCGNLQDETGSRSAKDTAAYKRQREENTVA